MSKILRSAFKTELADLCGINSQILRNKMNTYINTGLRDISKSGDYDWLKVDDGSITAVAGTRKYDLAANFRKMANKKCVYYIDTNGTFHFLDELKDEDFLARLTDATASRSSPEVYRVFETDNAALTASRKSKIHIDPVPSADFVAANPTIYYEYFRWIDLPTDDAHYIELPDDFLPLLRTHCLSSIYENYRKSRTIAKQKMDEFKEGIILLLDNKEKVKTRNKRTRTVYGRYRSRLSGRHCI